MKRTIVRVLMAAFTLGCVVTAVSSLIFVYETEDVHQQRMTYEKGLPFPYIVETARVYRGRPRGMAAKWWWAWWDPVLGYYTYNIGCEILIIPLLSSILSNTVAVAGIIGIILIGEKKSNLRGYRLRDQ